MSGRSLLVVGCSSWKRNYEEPMPALYVYENQVSRFLRRVLEGRDVSIDVYVLSAGYGLISGWDLIEWYDEELTLDRVRGIKEETTSRLRGLLLSGLYSECLVALSRRYFSVLSDAFVGLPVPIELLDPAADKYAAIRCWVEARL